MSDDIEHTPEPWQADVDHKPYETPFITAHKKPEGNAYVVAEVNQNGLLKGDWKANARIIAAAPELLEAAKHSLNVLTRIKATHDHLLSKRLLTELDNAISKAEVRHE